MLSLITFDEQGKGAVYLQYTAVILGYFTHLLGSVVRMYVQLPCNYVISAHND